MYLDKIKTLYNFNKNVMRNTPMMSNEYELSDLVDDEFDVGVAKKTIMRNKEVQFSKIQYHAIDYTFSRIPYFKSRFSDGSFPAWYASLDPETTFYETSFHWYIRIIGDMNYSDKKSIVAHRSLFSVGCSATLLDLRSSVSKVPELIGAQFESYGVTQVLGREIYSQSLPGIYTYSARKQAGENVAIYTRKSLSHAQHLDDIKYIYDFQNSSVSVLNKNSGNLLMEIIS
jgi:hypothetical protein